MNERSGEGGREGGRRRVDSPEFDKEQTGSPYGLGVERHTYIWYVRFFAFAFRS